MEPSTCVPAQLPHQRRQQRRQKQRQKQEGQRDGQPSFNLQQRRKNSHTFSEHVRTRAKLTTYPVTYRRNFTDEHCRTGVFRQCRYSKARQTEGIHHAKGTNPEKAHCTTAPHPADSHTN